MVTLKGVEPHKIANNIKPFFPVHPGGLLKEELECRNLQQKEFAKKLGLPYTAFNEILNEKRSVTSDFALVMEAALGIPAYVLVNLQADYNLQMSQRNKKLSKRLEKIRKIVAM